MTDEEHGRDRNGESPRSVSVEFPSPTTRQRSIPRNALISLFGQGLPLAVAFISIPFLVQGLGTERYGVLSLIWAVFGYFTVLDMGLGRAVTKSVAESLATSRGDGFVPTFWSAASMQLLFGTVGGLGLALFTPVLVERVLNIPPALVPEAKLAFVLSAISLPILLLSSSVGGLLEATQRFDLRYAVITPVSLSNYLLPLVAIIWWPTLPVVVAILVVTRLAALIAQFIMAKRVLPDLTPMRLGDRANLYSLFSFGGWITVANVVKPILNYGDRLFIGTLMSMSAVAYYTVPFELVTRLWIVPTSILAVMFPVFSGIAARGETEFLQQQVSRTLKYMLCLLGLCVITLIVSASDVMSLWMGEEFSRESSLVLQILAVGVLVDSLAAVPSYVLQAIGRPDIPAKLQLVEIPVQILMVWYSVRTWGIPGAAIAWTARVFLDALLFFYICHKVAPMSSKSLAAERILRISLAMVVFCVLMVAIGAAIVGPVLRLMFSAGVFLVLGLITWYYFFTAVDRTMFLNLVRRSSPGPDGNISGSPAGLT